MPRPALDQDTTTVRACRDRLRGSIAGPLWLARGHRASRVMITQKDSANEGKDIAMTELYDLSAVEARRLIGTKEVSPVELLDACLDRIAAVNPALNAVVSLDAERARAAASEAERAVLDRRPLGPLHGLPVGIKDLTETAGLRTTFGSRLFEDHVPTRDEGVVASLRAAGAIVLAKTNTPEFGTGAVTTNQVYGMTGNPFDP